MTDEQRIRRNECARQNREWKKEQHKCVRCGKQDAYTLIGRSYCYECCEYDKNHPRSERVRENNNARQREQYHKCIELGICPTCKKRKATDGYKNCPICRSKKARKRLEYQHANGTIPQELMDGTTYCSICAKPLNEDNRIKDKKICKRCYQSSLKNLSKAMENRVENAFTQAQYLFWEEIKCRKLKASKE